LDTITAAAVIYAIVGAVKKQFPQVAGIVAFGVSLVLGAGLGYFKLFGVDGVEQGIIASLSGTAVNTLVNKVGK